MIKNEFACEYMPTGFVYYILMQSSHFLLLCQRCINEEGRDGGTVTFIHESKQAMVFACFTGLFQLSW